MGRIFDARVAPLVVGVLLLGCEGAPPAPPAAGDDGGVFADRSPQLGSGDGALVVDPPTEQRDASPIDAAPDAPLISGPCGNGVMDPGEMCDDGVGNDDVTGACSHSCLPLIEWTARHDGTAHRDDEAAGVAWDPAGFVLVTGSEGITADDADIWVAKLTSTGGPVWSHTHGGPAARPDVGQGVAVDISGNVVVNATEWLDLRTTAIWTRKYDSAGVEQWTRSYAPGMDAAGGVTTDALGNILVAGTSSPDITQRAFVRKYSASGNPLWTREISGVSGDSNGTQGIALGPAGSVMVSGFLSQTRAAFADFWVAQLSSNGADLWSYVDGSTTLVSATGVAVLGDSAIACGYAGRDPGSTDVWVRRIDARGQLLWSREYVRNGPDRCGGIAVDPTTGDIVVGISEDSGLTLGRAVLRKYDQNGVLRWTRAYRGAAALGARANAVTIGERGVVLVAGTERTAAGHNDAFVRAFAP